MQNKERLPPLLVPSKSSWVSFKLVYYCCMFWVVTKVPDVCQLPSSRPPSRPSSPPSCPLCRDRWRPLLRTRTSGWRATWRRASAAPSRPSSTPPSSPRCSARRRRWAAASPPAPSTSPTRQSKWRTRRVVLPRGDIFTFNNISSWKLSVIVFRNNIIVTLQAMPG